MAYSDIEINESDDNHHNADTRFLQAIVNKQFSSITQLIDDNLIDPNKLIDPKILKLDRKDLNLSSGSYTILHVAIMTNNEALLDALLASKITHLDQTSADGETALHIAARLGFRDLVEKLLIFGADPTITYQDKTPEQMTQKSAIKNLFHKPSWTTQLNSQIANMFIRKHSQSWLMDKMLGFHQEGERGYLSDKGTCFGLSGMSTLSILGSTRNDQRELIGLLKIERILKHLRNTSTEKFLDRIRHLEHERLRLWIATNANIQNMDDAEIGHEIDNMLALGRIMPQALEKASTNALKKSIYLQLKFEDQIKEHLSENEQIDLEIPNFFDGIEMCQSIDQRVELVPSPVEVQSLSTVLPLLMPKTLVEQGGISEITRFTGVFLEKNTQHKDEVEIYFECLHQQFKNLNAPISLILGANMHSLSVHYDPIKDYWIFIDANARSQVNPVVKTSDSTKIARLVRQGFTCYTSPGPFIMTTEVYTTKLNAAHVASIIALLNVDEAFNTVFEVTPQKATIRDFKDRTWLQTAIRCGEINTVKKLHALGYFELERDLDQVITEHFAKHFVSTATFYENQRNFSHYGTRDSIISLAKDVRKKIDAIFIPTKSNLKEKHVLATKFKFLVDVLKNSPIENDAESDRKRIMFALMLSFTHWQYQGRDVDALTIKVSNYEENWVRDNLLEKFSDVFKIQTIMAHDDLLSGEIRELIHELETGAEDPSIVDFFAKVLQKAAILGVQSSQEVGKTGGFVDAFNIIHSESTQSVQKKIDSIIQNSALTQKCNDAIHHAAKPNRISTSDKVMRNLVTTALEFERALEFCSQEQGVLFYDMMQPHLHALIKEAIDFYRILKNLSSEKRTAIYQQMKPHLPNMIRPKSSDYEYATNFLSDTDKVDFNHIMTLHWIKTDFSSHMSAAVNAALLNNDNENIKLQIDRLIKTANRSRYFPCTFTNQKSSEKWIDIISNIEPGWLKKINIALNLGLSDEQLTKPQEIERNLNQYREPQSGISIDLKP